MKQTELENYEHEKPSTEIHERGTSSQAVTDPWHLRNIVWEAFPPQKGMVWLVSSSQSNKITDTTNVDAASPCTVLHRPQYFLPHPAPTIKQMLSMLNFYVLSSTMVAYVLPDKNFTLV